LPTALIRPYPVTLDPGSMPRIMAIKFPFYGGV
jgi:hypothetical protein